MSPRQAQFPVDPRFTQRWSARAFTGKAITTPEVMSLFEAARWAPSASNTQPWRFVFGLAGSPGFEAIFQTLVPFNRGWAQRASALIAVLSATHTTAPGASEAKPIPSHAFDTGAAWMSLALQAQHTGWCAHAMGGFDKEALRQALDVPEGFALHCVVAVGEQADPSVLDETLQARETPNSRQPLDAMVAEGRFVWKG